MKKNPHKNNRSWMRRLMANWLAIAMIFIAGQFASGNADIDNILELEAYMNLNKETTVHSDEELLVEILGVTVVPHHISYEIPPWTGKTQGALVRVFLRNSDPDAGIQPELLLNGFTINELLASKMLSYCNVPEIRVNNITREIPANSVDYFLLNIMQSSFYAEGITMTIIDQKTGRRTDKQIEVLAPDFFLSRITFSSSVGSVIPDGFYLYFDNNSDSDVNVNSLKIWPSHNNWRNHYWQESFIIEDVRWFGQQGLIAAGDMNGAYVHTGTRPFGEIILEFDVEENGEVRKIFHSVKPMIIEYDLGMGWANSEFHSELFCKTAKRLHMNTVNSNLDNLYSADGYGDKYTFKRFSNLIPYITFRRNDTLQLRRIHGEEQLGEPQVNNKPAQPIFDLYSIFRNSGFPTTLSMTHEPGFNRFAGIVDLIHFDAYRIVAPHSDRWGQYFKYGEKNVTWGAPLETIGDYMRTLNRISYPNRIAAWTQAMDNGWRSIRRINHPNELEMRIQAYQAVANGSTSLYWFTMGGAHLKNHRFNLPEIHRVNREIKLVGDLLTKTVPFYWVNTFMDIDINVLAGPDFAALFAIDLKYAVSSQNQFVSSGPSFETMEFNLPLYLHNANAAVKVSHDGVREIDVLVTDGKAYINDTIHTTGLYLLYNSSNTNYGELMVERYEDIVEEEASYGFDPINNDDDWDRLVLHIDITLGNIPRPTLSIQLNPENGGTVKGAGRYFPTARIALDAKAGSGYIFKGWTDVSGQPLHLEDGKFYMSDEDTTILANFDSTVGGISEHSLSSTVRVYPNPGRGLFQLEYRSQNESSMEIEIFNSIGRKVYAKAFGRLPFVIETIDLRHLNNGIYYLRLKDNMGMHTVNIVLQK